MVIGTLQKYLNSKLGNFIVRGKMKKKVCHITSVHGRYDTRIFYKECISLAKHGYDVTFVVNEDECDETVNGVKIESTKFKPKNRVERFIKSKRLLMRKSRDVDADIYHLHDPDLLPIGNQLKKMGKIVIFDSHEDIPLQIIDKGWMPKHMRKIVSKVYETYEKYSIGRYDAVISVTPKIVERLAGINSNSVMITNYPIIAKEDENKERNSEFALCFAGGVRSHYHHEEIIKAMENINGLRYILAGPSTDVYLRRLRSLPAWNRVEFLGVIPYIQVKDIYNRAIAGVAIHYSNQAKTEGSLGGVKLFEYMEAKLPVICSGYRLWKEIVEGNNCGICVDPKNIKEIENAIRYLIDNPEKARLMGENGRRAVVEKYNWRTQEKILLMLYEKIQNSIV